MDEVFSWLDQHNGAVTATATVALALLTAVLALLNRGLLRATAKATNAAVRAAEAAEDEAKASRESIELDWRPVLTFHHATGTSTVTEGFSMSFAKTVVHNVGRGPGLNVRFLQRKRNEKGGTDWQMTKRFSLAGGDNISSHSWVRPDPRSGVAELPEPADEVWGGAFPRAKEVLICQDQAGHYYRFIDPRTFADVWRDGEEPRPVWLDWYRGFLDND